MKKIKPAITRLKFPRSKKKRILLAGVLILVLLGIGASVYLQDNDPKNQESQKVPEQSLEFVDYLRDHKSCEEGLPLAESRFSRLGENWEKAVYLKYLSLCSLNIGNFDQALKYASDLKVLQTSKPSDFLPEENIETDKLIEQIKQEAASALIEKDAEENSKKSKDSYNGSYL